MKTKNIILILIFSILIFGQAYGQKYSKIEITYSQGFYPFNKIGKFDTHEKIIIKPVSATEYKIEKYCLKKKYQYLFKSTWTKKRIKDYKTKYESEFINGFIKSLSTDSFPITSASFNSKEYLKNITLRKIKRMARHDNNAWFFRKINSDTSELNYYVRDIKNPARLDSFLVEYQLSRNYDLLIVDIHHYLEIKIFSQNDSLLYESNLLQDRFWGQPIIDNYSTRKDSCYSPYKHVFNLEINKYLLDILPKNSVARKRFEIDKFLYYYIAWYAERAYKGFFEM